jgi:phage gp45-like
MGSGTELAKAYVQIIPSAEGIKGKISDAIGGEAGSAGSSAGSILGKNLGSTLIKAVGALGLGQALKETLLEGADLQQSLGGVETLFKEHADIVIDNAKRAYETAGLSANDYMETVTSFSASLLQGLGGNTELAASIADRALVDMADNANKMGTSMESIQNAYQGFAKQNYTMLDNLKLGYGGTKEEMARLIADASKMTDIQKELGITVDESSTSFDNIINAISVMQKNMGIAGATSAEAAGTFSGSFAAMKAAAENFMANLALGEDVGPALMTLLKTAGTFALDNLLPMVGNILSSLVEVIFTTDWLAVGTDLVTRVKDGISAAAIKYLGSDKDIIDNLLLAIGNGLPSVLKKGSEIIVEFANGILSNMPSLISTAGSVLTKLISFIMENAPTFLSSGAQLLLKMAQGLIQNMPTIIVSLANVLANLLKTIAENLPSFLFRGMMIIGELASGLIEAIPTLVSKIPEIVASIFDTFTRIDWKSIGTNIIEGIAKGLKGAGKIILNAVEDVAGSALTAIKKLLGIKSPSRVFRDQVGKMIDLGLAAGIEKNIGVVTNSMKDLSAATVGTINTDFTVGSTASYSTASRDSDFSLQALYELLGFYLPQLANMKMVTDTGALVGQLAPGMDYELGRIAEQKGRGR